MVHMKQRIMIGNCGWSYLNPLEFFDEDWKSKFKSKLQAYAKIFDSVEVNSTFYRLPRVSTAERWREEASEANPEFEFTVKVSQVVTHLDRFSSEKSIRAFEKTKEIAKALNARVLVFQSPASFKPSSENLERVRRFFQRIDREGFILVWEVRWEKDWSEEIVKEVFSEIQVNQCVDPLRQKCFFSKEILYYRLHGFGKPSMYNYRFSDDELRTLAEKCKSSKKVYVMFNNASCYEDSKRFEVILQR